MEYSDKNEHLNDDPLENSKYENSEPKGTDEKSIDKPAPAPEESNSEEKTISSDKATATQKLKKTPVSDQQKESSRDAEKVKSSPDKNALAVNQGMDDKNPGIDTPPETIEKTEKKTATKQEKPDDPDKIGSKEAAEAMESKDAVKDEANTKEDKDKSTSAGVEKEAKDKIEEMSAKVADEAELKEEDTEQEDVKGKEAEKVESTEDEPEKKQQDEKAEDTDAGSTDKVNETPEEKQTKVHKSVKVEKIEEEKINYELLSKEDLVKIFDDILSKKTFEELRNEVDDIQSAYDKKHQEEIEEKRKRFIEEGGVEQDFKPVEDPADKRMTELSEKYKTLKTDYNKQLEQVKEENLQKKQEILEEFRILMEGQEAFESTFRKFKQLQKKWFDAGIVPKQNVKDLWNSYNYFVEKFNDYVKINRELREMDLKKNMELKTKLCEKTEALAEEKNINAAFKTLQKYHSQWREIGPVPREEKDALWERFKAATSIINRAHQKTQSELKDSLIQNLELKKSLCEKTEALAEQEMTGHNEWIEKTNELLSIQKEWKTIGYAPKKDNNLIYARFRKACDKFFEKKAAFYAETYENQKENLEPKKEIVVQANAIKDSNDWKTTTEKLIELQKKWKEVGPVPRKESDRLWKQFRAACDTFFNNKSAHFSGKDESFEDNLKAKGELIKEMETYTPSEKLSETLKALENFQERYYAIGFVPAEVKEKIRTDFQTAQSTIIEKLKLDDIEKSSIRFKLKISNMMQNPRGENKIRFERDKLVNKLQQLKNDIGVWENNIGFFKETKSSQDTISEFQVKIEEAHMRIQLLEKKIRIIDELEDEA